VAGPSGGLPCHAFDRRVRDPETYAWAVTDGGEDQGRESERGTEGQPEALVVAMSRGKAADALAMIGLFEGAIAFMLVNPNRIPAPYLDWPVTRVLLALCAAFFVVIFVLTLARLVRGAPVLVVDRDGFHQRGATIGWDRAQSIVVGTAPGTRQRVRQLSIVPAGGKPIRINDRQTDSTLEEIVAWIDDWADHYLAPGTLRLASPGTAASSLFSAVQFAEATPGYEPAQVDAFLVKVSGKVKELQEMWRATQESALEAEARLRAAAERRGVEWPAPTVAVTGRAPRQSPLGSIQFMVVRRGYDQAQVDRFLHDAGLKIAELQDRYDADRERSEVADMRVALLNRDAPLPGHDPTLPGPGATNDPQKP